MIDEKIIDVDWQETRRFLEEKYFSKIRELSKKYDYPCENIAIDFNWVFGLIEKIEQQLKTDWIPCEERLPEEKGQYLVCDDKGNIYESTYYPFMWLVKSGTIDILAWQPLPQPYKKEGAE